MKILKLPKSAKNVVDRYDNLELGGKKIPCTYFINISGKRDLRSMVGKGTPEEIEMEAKIWEKLKGAEFERMSEKEIREFLNTRGIGVDCSAMLIHVLNAWYKEETGKPIWKEFKNPYKSLRGKTSFWLRPVENLGTDFITNDENTEKITINEARPGDVIRSKWKKRNSHHILLIEEVHLDANNQVRLIRYVNSTPHYGSEAGIRHGEIRIHDVNKPLEQQEWNDFDENGVNFTLEGFLVKKEDNGLRRLKAMEGLIKTKL